MVAVILRRVDKLSDSSGVEVMCEGNDGTFVTLAFIVGFEWRRGALSAEVQVLRDTASEWTRVGGETPELHAQLESIVREVLGGASLMLQRGRFRVLANA